MMRLEYVDDLDICCSASERGTGPDVASMQTTTIEVGDRFAPSDNEETGTLKTHLLGTGLVHSYARCR